jgi:hypothetical protein
MARLTKADEQEDTLRPFIKRCTEQDLRYVIRLLKHDIRSVCVA